ncbi:SAP domain-containing ribonucleoprotein [Condylostylus longicornis]|uniref:SAP domain-containing ribonucleoprotein n=1 Tax=Condylostylus longicornis TaxID=2530218 RepID=UPI00244E3991|nr:SAP domain-containing ribonucleoprotein [Condylostylus longicornis]
MSETDVLKMKVADLKRELKLRGLSITGNKTELQERLQSALLDGDLSLEDTAISEDVLLDEDGLTDEEVPVSPIPEENSTPNLENKHENVLSSTATIEKEGSDNQPKKTVVLKRKLITLSESNISSDENQTIQSTSEEPSEKEAKIEITADVVNNENNTQVHEKRTLKVKELTTRERMEMRAKKFGVSSSIPSLSELGNKKIHHEKINMSDPKTIEALKKRAERFGIITAPQISAIEKEEKLQKRKERFGLASDDKNATNKVITNNPDYAEKARLRLERFKTTATN